MDDNIVVNWKALRNYWIENYCSNTDILLQQFLEPALLFAPGAPGVGLPLQQGLHAASNEYQIYALLDHAEQLAEGIADCLQIDPPLDVPQDFWLATDEYEGSRLLTMHDKAAYQRLNRQVTQANKRQRKLKDAQNEWRWAKKLLRQKSKVFVALDIEAYEADHSILLEIGWTLYDSRSGLYMDQHYMMEPYRHLRNGKYVDDQRMSFSFGVSVWCTLDQALKELYNDLAWATRRDGGFVLVGHGLNSDLLYLEKCKFAWPMLADPYSASSFASYDNRKNNDGSDDNAFVLDDQGTLKLEESALETIINTDVLYGASIGDLHNPPSLGRCLTLLNIDHFCLHNAGNDAHYTMALMMKLADGA